MKLKDLQVGDRFRQPGCDTLWERVADTPLDIERGWIKVQPLTDRSNAFSWNADVEVVPIGAAYRREHPMPEKLREFLASLAEADAEAIDEWLDSEPVVIEMMREVTFPLTKDGKEANRQGYRGKPAL
jgi:hypothetical protein